VVCDGCEEATARAALKQAVRQAVLDLVAAVEVGDGKEVGTVIERLVLVAKGAET